MKMKDIADAAGVSAATVSKVLNGVDEHISDATRNRILSIVEKNGYVPNEMAKGLKMKRSKMIGFILPDISNPFFPSVAKGLEDTAHNYGYGVIIANTNDSKKSESEALRFLSSRMVGGIVFAGALQSEHIEKCVKTDLPVVVVDRAVEIESSEVGRIVVDTPSGTYESTKILINAGCRRIAFISALYNSKADRYYGYLKALEEAGIPLDESLVYKDRFTFDTGYDGTGRILGKNEVDGIVCGNDLIAVGVNSYLKEKDIRVPEDIKLMGFDDIYFSRYMTPPLSTVRQPAYEMGSEAAKMIIEYLENGIPLYEKKMDYTIVMRGTV